MRFEMRRYLKSPYFPISLGFACLLFVIGHTIQNLDPHGITLLTDLLSTYVMYTQVAPLMLAALVMSYVCGDYAEKDILFYRQLGFGATRYWLAKVATLLLGLSLGTLASSLLVCALWGDLSPWGVMFLHYEAVLVAYVAIMATFALLLRDFIVSFFANVACWICSIVIVVSDSQLWLVSFYDQHSPVYKTLADNVAEAAAFSAAELPRIGSCFLYDACAVAACLAIVTLLRRRWLRNGV